MRNRTTRLPLLSVLAVLLIAGCQTFNGQGPLPIDSDMAARIEVAMAQRRPIDTIAISKDAKTLSMVYCKVITCSGNPVEKAIRQCELRSGGVHCFLYSRGDNLVWNFGSPTDRPVMWRTGRLTMEEGKVAIDLDLVWKDDPDRADIRVLTHPSGYRDCSGSIHRRPNDERVEWQFGCASGQAYRGRLRPENRTVLIGPGSSKDNKKHAILSLRESGGNVVRLLDRRVWFQG